MKSLYEYNDDDIYHEKARILQDMELLDSALRHLGAPEYNAMLRKIALIADAGLELGSKSMDPRVKGQILDDASELAKIVDRAIEEWITAEDVK